MNMFSRQSPMSRIGWVCAGVLLIGSCRSMPVASFPEIVNWLPEESNLLLRIEVVGNEELAELLISLAGMNPEEFQPVIRRTALLAFGAEITKDVDNLLYAPIHATAIGLWPRGLLGGILGSEWSQSRNERFVWEGPNYMKLAAPSNEEIIISRTRMDMLLRNRRSSTGLSGRWPRMPRNADLAVLVDDTELVNRLIPFADGRVDGISAALRKKEFSRYEVKLDIFAAEESLAPSLALAIRLAASSRFGTSSIPEERDLIPRMKVETDSGVVTVNIEFISLAIIHSLLAEIDL